VVAAAVIAADRLAPDAQHADEDLVDLAETTLALVPLAPHAAAISGVHFAAISALHAEPLLLEATTAVVLPDFDVAAAVVFALSQAEAKLAHVHREATLTAVRMSRACFTPHLQGWGRGPGWVPLTGKGSAGNGKSLSPDPQAHVTNAQKPGAFVGSGVPGEAFRAMSDGRLNARSTSAPPPYVRPLTPRRPRP